MLMGLKLPVKLQKVVWVDELADQALPNEFGHGACGLLAFG